MCTKQNGRGNKKILLLTVVVLICFLSSCFSGLQDWDKDIINGYSLIRVNDGVIVISLINGSKDTRAVDEYVDQYCYNDTYIGAKRIPIPEGVHMTYEEICQLETITYEYYLINTITKQVDGPLTEEEYVDLCEEIDIEMCDWITTHSLEKYVKKTEPTDTTIVIETEPETEQTFDKTEEKHTYTLDKEYAELLSKAESNVETVSINNNYTEKWEELAQIYYEKILYSIENNDFADEFYGEGTNEKALLMMEQWQTDWNNYYESQMNYYNEFLEYTYGAGSIVPVAASEYKMKIARERALELYDMCLLLYIDVEAP